MIGTRLKKIRLERGYSLTRLAEESGISKSYISYLERGVRTNPSLQVLIKISKTLNCELEYILGDQYTTSSPISNDDEIVSVVKSLLEKEPGTVDIDEFHEYINHLHQKAMNKK